VKADIVNVDWTDQNTIALLHNGADYFPALCQAINEARISVQLETYIFILDRTGERVLQCLEQAARRGVNVRLIVDGFGSASTATVLRERMRQAGGECAIYRPEPPWYRRLVFSRKRLRRLHRKMTVIDGKMAFVGGINIIDDYDDIDPYDGIPAPRYDFAVRVEGPLVSYAIYAQELLWMRVNWGKLHRHPKNWSRVRKMWSRKPVSEAVGQQRAALVLRDNVRYRQTFERAYLYGIQQAKHDILIANAYFFPGSQFRRALLQAAARGVRVRLLLQGKIEYHLQYYATRSLYDQLLQGDIEVYEYMPSYLHAKVVVIDDMAMVGSSNLDPFSLLLAREANVIVDDVHFAHALKDRLEAGIRAGGRMIRPSGVDWAV
jgi:cardiolipin synthase